MLEDLVDFARGTLWAVRRFFVDKRAMRDLEQIPRVGIGAVAEGVRARVEGVAQLHAESLEAPWTGGRCLAYTVAVEEYRSSGDGDGSWRAVLTEQRGAVFVLDDDTGRALVDPGAAALFAIPVATEAEDPPRTSARLLALLARHQLDAPGSLGRSLRVREGVIEVGAHVAVVGEGIREPDPTAAPGDYRGAHPTLLRLTSSAKHRLVIAAR